MKTAYLVTFIALVLIAGSGHLINALTAYAQDRAEQIELAEFQAEMTLREMCRHKWTTQERFDECVKGNDRYAKQ